MSNQSFFSPCRAREAIEPRHQGTPMLVERKELPFPLHVNKKRLSIHAISEIYYRQMLPLTTFNIKALTRVTQIFHRNFC